MKKPLLALGLFMFPALSFVSETEAQRVTYPPEEFTSRRQALCESLESQAQILLFGKTKVQPGVRFRQDPDFYYFTGTEDLNAILHMDAATCASVLFLPSQTKREASRDGWNLLYQDGGAEAHGFSGVHPLTYLQEFLSRRRTGGPQTVYVRLSEKTEVDQSRSDMAIFTARRMANPFGAYPTEDAWRIETLRERFPYYEFEDITPFIDPLRMIKTPREIAAAIFEEWGLPNQYPGGAGHFVGMSVHDVGDYDLPLQAGMVIAVEPIIDIPEEDLHIRIEDTILVTENGPEILSAHVPKELDEVLALVGRKARPPA